MFLSVVHLHPLLCSCGEMLAQAGARSFVVDAGGDPLAFSAADPPAEMVVAFTCGHGHVNQLRIPNELSAEETMQSPDDAPLGADAVLVEGRTESGAAILS